MNLRTRRSGISNLIGAIFFILVVGLVVSTLAIIFGASSGFINGLHTSNEQAVGNSNTYLRVNNMTFGATYASLTSPLAVSPNPAGPLLPVPNMNFTGGDSGWYVSKGFSVLQDNATVTNTNSSAVNQLPSTNGFKLTVENTDTNPGRLIQKVTLLVDTNITSACTVPPCLSATTAGLPIGSTVAISPPLTGGNITWTIPAGLGILQHSADTFQWSATPLPAKLGTFYDTVVLSWYTSTNSFLDSGIGTVNTNTTIISTHVWLAPGVSSAKVQGTHSSFVPGGLTAGYDGGPLSSSSSSGPGSLYASFQPSVNSTPLPAGDQLTANVNFTAPFTLQNNIAVTSPVCCSVSWESDLASLSSVHNPLIYYHVYLQNTSKIWVMLNPGGTDPTLVNYFQPSGWHNYSVQFSPAPTGRTVLHSGTYNITVSVSMTLPAGSDPSVLMNFDDIGVSITPGTGSTISFGSQQFLLNVGVAQDQVQGLTLGANMTAALPPESENATAYLFAADDSSGTPTWTEVGSAFFNSSAAIRTVIPLPNAAYYVSASGMVQLLVRVVVIGTSCGGTCSGLTVTAFAITSSIDQNRSVVAIQAMQAPQPVRLVSLYISGPNGLTVMTPLNEYLATGEILTLQTSGFSWLTGQTYTVTVTTSNGLTFSRSFVAPDS
ncbi:MAG: hypothetical protein JRN09_05120 [Nitrososphaerota archaeon]|nr:hypothetical protein [Nitrososphaerota archaeon]